MKAERIEAIYSQHAEFSIPDIEDELDIKWEDVEDYDIRWPVLQLEMKDGKVLEYHGVTWGEMCTKYPDEVWEYGKDHEKCVKPNWRAGSSGGVNAE